MSNMSECPVCDIPPIHGKSAKDTRAGRSAAVDMAEPGDTLEQIAADELARLSKVTEVLKGIPDNAMRKARQEKMLDQLDDEMEMRRAAVQKRLKIALQRDVQAARDERPGKKAKHHRMTLDDQSVACMEALDRRDSASPPCSGAADADDEDLLMDAVGGVSLHTAEVRTTANGLMQDAMGQETFVESLDGGLGHDEPGPSGHAGATMLKAARSAQANYSQANHLRGVADRMDRSASAMLPPHLVHEQLCRLDALASGGDNARTPLGRPHITASRSSTDRPADGRAASSCGPSSQGW